MLAFAVELGADEAVQRSVRLAVSEAVTNVVRHAYGGRADGTVRVEARREGEELRVVVVDEGVGPTTRSASPGSGFGLGLVGASTLAHELTAGPDGRGSELTMRFALAG